MKRPKNQQIPKNPMKKTEKSADTEKSDEKSADTEKSDADSSNKKGD